MSSIINQNANSLDELFKGNDYKLKELSSEITNVFEILVHNKPINYIVKTYESPSFASKDIQTLAKLDCLDIVPKVKIASYERKFSFAVMTKEPGLELLQFINNNRIYINEHLIRPIFQLIFLGIEKIHAMGVVHGDLKPENILYDEDNHKVTFIDFDGKNTFYYCSPEKFHIQEACLTTKSDIWSLGITLYCMLTGKLPFKNRNEIMTASAQMNKKWSVELVDFLNCLLDKNTDRRYSASEALNHEWLLEE